MTKVVQEFDQLALPLHSKRPTTRTDKTKIRTKEELTRTNKNEMSIMVLCSGLPLATPVPVVKFLFKLKILCIYSQDRSQN